MPYIKQQTRGSMLPEKNVSSINNEYDVEGAGMLSFESKVTEKQRT